MLSRHARAWALVALSLVVPSAARADEPPPEPKPSDVPPGSPNDVRATARMVAVVRAGEAPARSDAALARIIDRPHTIAELEAGFIALPTAPISAGQRGGDTPFVGKIGRGDATLQTGLHILYRWNRSFAVGAGAIFAPSPTSDDEYGGLSGLKRTHSRSYLFMGAEGRWIPVHYKYVEAWVGASAGAVVVADRFTTEAAPSVPPILGNREVTVRTEGLALGATVGGSYYLSENWIAGVTLRGYGWFLPDSPRCSAIGDCATLTSAVAAVEFGLTIGYRLPL
ncbi:hypothetical protein AKJ09_00863 [Labilithrix luteola]|uniref:Outer membrane protein beta-barrel domain-containing protein n=1 Tax=Labilithrix luteola TaxID=1391654 RepID=A0A0K1PM69_9BACT|nr:hypothetical protein [Labilithrix luteola]AKU94199.1 hypothetical protein AKJ09_00863 [Labilithrix luteola]